MQESNYWTRLLERRISRRAALRTGAAGVGVAGAGGLLAACGGSSKNNGATSSNKVAGAASPASASSTAAAAGKPGGVYTSSWQGSVNGVDPHSSVSGPGSETVANVYSYLIRGSIFASQKGIVTELADKYEVMPDQVTYVFHLRPDVMIAQNSQNVPVRPLDSDDVIKNFDRIKDPKLGLNGFAFFNDHIDSYSAPDKQTVQIKTKGPYAWTLLNLGNNLVAPIAPKEWLLSPDLKKTAVGSGFMTLKELTENQQLILAKNPNYYIKDRPYLDTHTIKLFADQATQRTAFSSGQIDVYTAQNIDEAKELQKAGKDLQLVSYPGQTYNSVWMSVKQKPWDDPRVRRAISRAINRDEYIQLIGHGQGVPTGLITSVMKPYSLPDDELKTKLQPFNIKDAKDLLNAAGQPNLTFEFSYPTYSTMPDYVNIFVRQMAAAGITAKGQPQDFGTWLANYYGSKLTFSLVLNQEYQDANSAIQWYKTNGITGNNHYDTGFSDPQVDDAINKAAATMDEKQRVTAYQDTQRLIYSKDPPFLNFFSGITNTLLQPYVKNYPFDTLYSLGYRYEQDIWINK